MLLSCLGWEGLQRREGKGKRRYVNPNGSQSAFKVNEIHWVSVEASHLS